MPDYWRQRYENTERQLEAWKKGTRIDKRRLAIAREALGEIAAETGTPYGRIADQALVDMADVREVSVSTGSSAARGVRK